MHFLILGGVFLGWSLGSNDAANVFGTAVASRMVRYRTAALLIAVFVIAGALLQGGPGIEQVGTLTAVEGERSVVSAFVACIVAGLTVTVMTTLKLPVSATQALAGAVIGTGLFLDPPGVQWGSFGKMVLCWVFTPVGGAVMALILYPLLARGLDAMRPGLLARAVMLKIAIIIAGAYGAYALGANNVGNVTGPFYGTGKWGHDVASLALIGGAAIALGALTYSRNVMFTVGSRLVALDAFSALVAVLAEAATVHGFALLHVPVSTSQAIVGAVLGIGLHKGVKTINRRTLLGIGFGWVCTPAISAAAGYAAAALAAGAGWL